MTTPQPLTPSSSTESTEFTAPTGSTSIISPIEPAPQKKSPLIAILLTLLILATGTAAYFYSRLPKADPPWVDTAQSQPTASATPSTSADPTAEWQVGSFSQLQFKYPSNWKISYDQNNNLQFSLPDSEYPHFTVNMIDNPENTPLKEFGSDWEIKPNFYSATAEALSINDQVGYYQQNRNCEPFDCDMFAINYEGKIYTATMIYREVQPVAISEQKSKYRAIFSQILQTFQFIDQAIFTNNQEDNTFTKPPIGYITDIKFGYNNYILTVDYIDYIEDNSAPSGYRIDNSSNQTVTIQTDVPGSTPKIIMQTYSHTADGNFAFNQEITFGQFLEAYNNQHELWSTTPFWFDLLEDTVIVITQQYLP